MTAGGGNRNKARGGVRAERGVMPPPCLLIVILPPWMCFPRLSFLGLISLCLKLKRRGAWVAQSVKRLPSAPVMISGSWDQAPYRAPCPAGGLLLPLSPSPLLVLSLSLSLKSINQSSIKKIYKAQKKVQGPPHWDPLRLFTAQIPGLSHMF